MAKKVSKNKSSLDESKSAGQPVASASSTSNATPKSKGASKVSSPPPSPPDMDLDELPDSPAESSDDENGGENVNGAADEWPKEDDLDLISKIRNACPKEDQMKYDTRVNQIDWNTVKFGIYSADDCKQRWIKIMSHLRHFRILSEVLSDAVTWRKEFPWYNFNKGGKATMKHPDLPKKPLTSYMLFYMEQKTIAAKENPGFGMTELSKHVAKLYNSLNEKKKQKYVQLAEAKKMEYNNEMIKFIKEHPDYVPPKSANKFGPKAVPPKLPTPLKLYSDQQMPKFVKNGSSATEARNMCAKGYRDLSEKQKMKWINQALQEEAAYHEAMNKFKLEHPDVDLSTKKVALLTKEEMQIKDKYNGKPEKPPNSGYSLFSKELLSGDKLKAFESKERMTEISRMWKELSDDDKTEFNERAQALNLQFKMKYASYLESLSPEQRTLEITSGLTKGLKRPAAIKKAEVEAKKARKDEAESPEEDETEDDEFEQKKPAIQKPHSSLQKFCDTNEQKYRKKFPTLDKQDLTRMMAKEFAKLSPEQRKKYDTMAQKSKNESSASGVKSSPKTSKSKASAASPATPSTATKPGLVAKATAITGSVAKAGSPATKKTATKASATSNGSSKASSKSSKEPEWATKLPYWPGEPFKPREQVAEYYAGTQNKSHLSQEAMDELWSSVPAKQRKKIAAEHKKKQSEYQGELQEFLETLGKKEISKFKRELEQRKKAVSDDEDSDDEAAHGSDSEESDAEEDKNEDTSSEEDDDDD